MSRFVRMTVAVLTSLGLLTLGVPSPGTSQEAAARASLSVSPGSYVAGQKMTYTGSIGVRGKRRVKLQYHMNRPGDRWTDVHGFRSRSTDAAGRFRFTFPAPAMWGISYRVVSGRHATPRHTFHAKSQEVVLEAGNNNRVVAGRPFEIVVDTAPAQKGRHDLPPPPIPGRRVILQQRVSGDQWKTLGDTTTNNNGIATFGGMQVADPGAVVYRAVEDDWTKNGHKIGWFPSFPTYVEVVGGGAPRSVDPRSAAPAVTRITTAARAGGSPNASQNYGWGRSLFDFAWEFGESLTSKPYRGTRLQGRWIDASNGTGRATHINGGLGLDSRPGASPGPGDRGTTTVTLKGNPQKYGRWEVRLRSWSRESSDNDYRVKIELIPDRAADYHCGAQNITVADYAIHTPAVRFGVNTRSNRRWFSNKGRVALADVSHNFAVEVAKDHITWYLDGRPIGTVKSRAAVSDVPLTLRLSLQGNGTTTEMNRTRSIFDWMRAWPIDTGRRVTNGPRMRTDTHGPSC